MHLCLVALVIWKSKAFCNDNRTLHQIWYCRTYADINVEVLILLFKSSSKMSQLVDSNRIVRFKLLFEYYFCYFCFQCWIYHWTHQSFHCGFFFFFFYKFISQKDTVNARSTNAFQIQPSFGCHCKFLCKRVGLSHAEFQKCLTLAKPGQTQCCRH